MKNKKYWTEWIQKAGARAIRTIAQTAIAGIGTAMAMGQVNWGCVFSASMLAGLLSLLTCISGLPEISAEKDSLIK